MNDPKIRFKGYTDAWEQRKFGEITELKSASRVHKEEWTTEGVPFYRSSDVMAALNKTQNEKAFISEELYERLSSVSGKLEDGDILVTGGGSVGNPYIVPNNEPLYTKDADLLWIKNQGRFDAYFIYEYFLSPTFRNYLSSISHVGTIAHYTITQLFETPVFLPSKDEQQKVGEYFRQLDTLITLHQRKCEETKKLKKYMLQKMFPQNGESAPEIRFAGFTDAWEQRKLGDFGIATGGTSIESEFSENGKYKVISIGSYSEQSTYTDQGLRTDKTEKTEKRILNKNDLTMILNDKTNTGRIIGRVLLIDADDSYVFNQRTERIEVDTEKYNPQFLYAMLNADNIRNKIIKAAQGNTQIYVNWPVISEFNYPVPIDLEEQKKLGEFFGIIDKIITLHQRKCDELQNMKKFMLQNMFA